MADIKYLDKTGLGTVKSILDGLFAPKSHNHNTLYYTKTESDNLLAGKSNTGHTHDYLSKTQYGYSIDTYRFDVGQTARGWVHLGYFYGSNSGIKIDCDYTSHCAPSYGICDSSITFGIRTATFEGYISKNAGTGSGLYITESKDNGYKYYHVYIYLKEWLQGHVRIQDLGSSSTFVWSITNTEPDSTHTVILDCRNLNGFYSIHNGQINKVIDEGNIGTQSVNYANSAGSAVDQTARNAAATAQTTADGKWTYNSDKFLRRDDTQGYLSKFILDDIPKNVTQVGSIGWTDYQSYPHAGGMWLSLKGNSSLRSALILFPTYNMSHPPILYSSIDNGAWQGGYTLAYRSDIPTNNNQLTNGAGYITGITKTMVTNALGYTPPASDTNTWLGDGTWAPSTNVKLNASANGQEWSFDIERNGKTGCYWHVWDSALLSLLKITADDGIVEAPYGFKGSLSGNASSATLLKPNSGITTNVATWNPLTSFTKCWGQNFTSSSLSSDTGDILYYLRRGDSGYGSTSTTELCVCIDGDYYGKGGGGTPKKVSYEDHTHSNYLTGITKDMVTSALGYTPPTTNTTYTFTDANPNLTWGTKSKVATVGGTDIHVTMPANPNTWPSLSNLGGVPINRSNYVYTNVACKYMAGTSPGYYRIVFPDTAKSIWNMVDMEIFVRQSYSNGNSGKILLYTHNNGSNIWQNLNATLVGNLTSDIKVYAAEGKYIYIGGCSAWGTINIDKILIGDGATTKDLSGITIDYVSSLPSVYQEATMRRYSTTDHTHTKSQITDFPTSLPANGGNATTATSAASLSGGSIATWGTLTSANGYTNVCTWDTGNTTGAFSLAGKGGQMSLQLDGFFYQNEGKYLVLDSNNYTTYTVKKDGTGASGSWGINITGSAGSVAWTNVTNRPTALSSFTNDSGYITNSPAYLEIMGNSVAYIDFHYNNSTTDFDARIACHANNQLRFHGHLTPSTSTVANAETIGLSNRRFNTIYALNGNFSGKVDAASGFFDTSDERLKNIIDTVNVNIDKLSELRKVYFNFKNDPEKKHIGVIAQDVQKIYPEIVEENGEGMLTVDYSKLSVIALDAVDQLNQKNKELEDRLNKIENLLKDKGIL